MDAYLVRAYLDDDDLTGLRYIMDKEIRQQELKRLGGNDLKRRASAAEKYIKSAVKRGLNLDGAWDDGDFQFLCDGFSGLMMINKIPGLPVLSVKPVDLLSIITGARKGGEEIYNDFDLADIIIHYKTANKKGGSSYTIADRFYDSKIIAECAAILGGDIKCLLLGMNSMCPMLLVSENGQAIILPLRKNNL